MGIVRRGKDVEVDFEYAKEVVDSVDVLYEDENCWVYDTSFILLKVDGKHTMEIATHISVGDKCTADIDYIDNKLWHTREQLSNGYNPSGGKLILERQINGCTCMLVDEETKIQQTNNVNNVIRFLNNLNLEK